MKKLRNINQYIGIMRANYLIRIINPNKSPMAKSSDLDCSGGEYGDRTHDIMVVTHALSQLS